MTDRAEAAVVIVGGGPAGLAAAEVVARTGVPVAIYDRMPSVGRKLLMAGRGGLNLTHAEPLADFLDRYGAARDRLAPMIRDFPPTTARAWAEGLGQPTFEGTSGRVFPQAMKASPLLRAWLGRLRELGVTIHTRHRWTGWGGDGALLFDGPAGAVAVRPRATILALGGASWPRLGSDGGWVATLARAGIEVSPLRPANAGIRLSWSPVFLQRFEGEPLKRMAITVDCQVFTGEAVVTRDGLEGGGVYAAFAAIRERIAADGVAAITIDVRPSFSIDELATKLAAPRRKQSTANFLRKAAGMAPIAIGLVREGAGGPLPADPATLAGLIKAIPFRITGTGDLGRAISTAGGVALAEVDDNLMLSKRPGVFVAGEMLDWEAPTGGYLLQATFATGLRAGAGALDWLQRIERR